MLGSEARENVKSTPFCPWTGWPSQRQHLSFQVVLKVLPSGSAAMVFSYWAICVSCEDTSPSLTGISEVGGVFPTCGLVGHFVRLRFGDVRPCLGWMHRGSGCRLLGRHLVGGTWGLLAALATLLACHPVGLGTGGTLPLVVGGGSSQDGWPRVRFGLLFLIWPVRFGPWCGCEVPWTPRTCRSLAGCGFFLWSSFVRSSCPSLQLWGLPDAAIVRGCLTCLSCRSKAVTLDSVEASCSLPLSRKVIPSFPWKGRQAFLLFAAGGGPPLDTGGGEAHPHTESHHLSSRRPWARTHTHIHTHTTSVFPVGVPFWNPSRHSRSGIDMHGH